MSDRIERVIKNHDKNYNCAQSVACAYCDLVGVDEKTMFRACEGFGLGDGCMEGTCGAVSGAVALAGFKNSTANLEKPSSKSDTYKLCSQMVKKFKEKNGSITCKDLKGIESGNVLRSCKGCMEDAAALVEEILELK